MKNKTIFILVVVLSTFLVDFANCFSKY